MSATAAAASTVSSLIRRGSCLCRSITFTLTGAPLRTIQCNCLNCQKSSGSAFLTNILYRAPQYRIDSGAEKVKTYTDRDTVSGGVLERTFCVDCGSNLSIRNVSDEKMKGNVVVCAGGLDGVNEWYVPQSELFKDRRHSWVSEVKKPARKDGSKI